jgi:hypothetical protein
MKNKLITSLLAFTALTSLAQQSNDATLLAHLKSVKAEIEFNLNESKTMLSQDAETDFAVSIVNDFFNEAKDLQDMLIDENVKPQFDLICNYTTLSQLPDVNCTKVTHYDANGKATGWTNVPTIIINLDVNFKKTLSELFTTIYTKHHTKYCQQDPHGRFAAMTTQNDIDGIFNEVLREICSNSCSLDTCPLLDMINTKINELEN